MANNRTDARKRQNQAHDKNANRRNAGADLAEGTAWIGGGAVGAALGSVLGPVGTAVGAAAGGALADEAVENNQGNRRNNRQRNDR